MVAQTKHRNLIKDPCGMRFHDLLLTERVRCQVSHFYQQGHIGYCADK